MIANRAKPRFRRKCPVDLTGLPGSELIAQGLSDLEAGRLSIPALLVLVGEPRLTRLGLHVPPAAVGCPEHELWTD
jgi:hypothetical protein